MLCMQLRVPESVGRGISLARRGADIVLERRCNAALLVNLHYWDTDQEIAIADGVRHEVIGAGAETAQSIGARHFDALESAGCVANGVITQVDVIELLTRESVAQRSEERRVGKGSGCRWW